MIVALGAQLGMSWAEAKGQPLTLFPPTSPGNFPDSCDPCFLVKRLPPVSPLCDLLAGMKERL